MSLDLSALFDNIDYCILLNCLQTSFGLNSTVLQWISSYLSNRSHFVQLRQSKSSISLCTIWFTTRLFSILFYSLRSFLLYHLFNSDNPNLQFRSAPSGLPQGFPRSYFIHFVHFSSILHRILSWSVSSNTLTTHHYTLQFHTRTQTP